MRIAERTVLVVAEFVVTGAGGEREDGAKKNGDAIAFEHAGFLLESVGRAVLPSL